MYAGPAGEECPHDGNLMLQMDAGSVQGWRTGGERGKERQERGVGGEKTGESYGRKRGEEEGVGSGRRKEEEHKVRESRSKHR